jgi:hypothetical protein
MSAHYFALRALVTGAGPYAAMTPVEAEAALNAATMQTVASAMLAPDEFVARFTPVEFAGAHTSADAAVRQLMFRLSVRREPLDLASVTVQQGLAYMAHIGLLTAERAAEIGAVPAGANITPAQSIGWPNERIWAADVLAARKEG